MPIPLRELSLPHPGILATDFYDNYELHCYEPPEDLRPYVVHLWTQRPRTRTTIQPLEIQTGPETYLFINDERAIVHGIFSKKFQYNPADHKVHTGVKFKPGGFHAFFKQPMHQLAGTTLEATNLFPEFDEQFRRQLPVLSDENIIMHLVQTLRRSDPVFSHSIEVVSHIMTLLDSHAPITSVHDISQVSGKSERTLQSLFREYIGVSPKWVLRRKRLISTLAHMQATRTTWASIVTEFGYTDQAHFSREFKAVTGITPREYTSRLL